MKLHTYFRSSAAYRVRIVLALKGVPWTPEFVHMLRGGGEQHGARYREVNAMGLVPALEDGPQILTQSLAICEYLEESYPAPPLLPQDPLARAYVRSIANTIACEIHPLNNLRVLKYVTGTLRHNDDEKLAWIRHWIDQGFTGVEAQVNRNGRAGDFLCGNEPGVADAFLVPQLYNARRFDCDLKKFPALLRIDANCASLPAFQSAHPDRQDDAA
jgi:maleylacetoacetate isomerase